MISFTKYNNEIETFDKEKKIDNVKDMHRGKTGIKEVYDIEKTGNKIIGLNVGSKTVKRLSNITVDFVLIKRETNLDNTSPEANVCPNVPKKHLPKILNNIYSKETKQEDVLANLSTNKKTNRVAKDKEKFGVLKLTKQEMLKNRETDREASRYKSDTCIKGYYDEGKYQRPVKEKHDKSLAARDRLKCHILEKHEGVSKPRDKICSDCSKAIAKRSTLANYIRTHRDERPHASLRRELRTKEWTNMTAPPTQLATSLKNKPN
ncbi:uncharacterized protein LOC142985624 [Anticarsia gemmatalis]|uniref:uncharacterized protein LOC142985624 n=1 Tax=Anticarsia gemmatalis TaxID=129554 RepID=UPI003F76DA35